ncbi:hypothetical protein HDU79_008844, partial [Rhizoclosmatium sp. JEL0117]
MADGGFRGTTMEQDSRFADKQKKLLKSMKFPASFNQKVDMTKVNVAVIKPWISKKVVELLGLEDELLINYIFEMLDDPKKKIDPKELQISLTDFLGATHTPGFVKSLWGLLLSAQESGMGIPKIFLEEKMKEVAKAEEEKRKIDEELQRRRGAVEERREGGREGVSEKSGVREERDGERRDERRREHSDRPPSRRDDYRDDGRGYDRERRRDRDSYDQRRDAYEPRRDSYRRDERDSYDRRRDDRDSYSSSARREVDDFGRDRVVGYDRERRDERESRDGGYRE